MARISRSENGFTLIEVIVALVVTAFLLGITSNAIETARLRDVQAAAQARALLVGEEFLARRAEAAFRPGDEQADRPGLRITTTEAAISRDGRQLFVLSEVGVAVRHRDGRMLYDAQLRRLKALPR